MFAQVKMFLRTVSVAVRVPGRESSRGHGHMADSVRVKGAVRKTARFADPCPFCPATRAGLLA